MRAFAWLLCGALACTAASASPTSGLPRFTEEREAAALFFLKKHVPEVLPLLDELKKSNAVQYQQEIREVFQATEMLAELQDDPRQYDLELKYWKAETRAHALVAKLSTSKNEEREKVEIGLRELARTLVDLDVRFLELRADQLDKELSEVKDELARTRRKMDKSIKAKYDSLLERAKKSKKD